MTTEEFLNILCDALGRSPNSLTLADTPQSVKQWDSIGHLSIISVLHETFEISGDQRDLRTFESIGELVDRLKTRGLLLG